MPPAAAELIHIGAAPACPISIVIPSFNEAAAIADSLQRLAAGLSPAAEDHQIVVVDDGSRDGTSRIVQALTAMEAPGCRIEGRRLPTNRGKGYAVRAGLALTKHPVVVVVDADVPVQVADIEALASQVATGGSDLCIGERTLCDARQASDVVEPGRLRRLTAAMEFSRPRVRLSRGGCRPIGNAGPIEGVCTDR